MLSGLMTPICSFLAIRIQQTYLFICVHMYVFIFLGIKIFKTRGFREESDVRIPSINHSY